MTAQVDTLAADGATGGTVWFKGVFNVVIVPSSDWSGTLHLQSSLDDGATWIDELTEAGRTDWGTEAGRSVGEEIERAGGLYRAVIPAGGHTAGSVTVRFSQ